MMVCVCSLYLCDCVCRGSTAGFEDLVKKALWSHAETLATLSLPEQEEFVKACRMARDTLKDESVNGLLELATVAHSNAASQAAEERMRQALVEFQAGGSLEVVHSAWSDFANNDPAPISDHLIDSLDMMLDHCIEFITEHASQHPTAEQLEEQRKSYNLMDSMAKALARASCNRVCGAPLA